jgi:8-oxo-dGTP pyrophosphatase MutT (NUDIX family)
VETPPLIQSIRQALLKPLPGISVQYKMAHVERRVVLEKPIPTDVRNAAVLILLFQKNWIWHFILIRRTAIDGDVHSGQISFPGGRMAASETAEEAAAREAHEEIGCPTASIIPLGRLTQLHIPVSNHLVFPVVAYLEKVPAWTAQEREVDEILEIPLTEILVPDAMTRSSILLPQGMVLRDVPSYLINNHLIWGGTAMILSEFSALLDEIAT